MDKIIACILSLSLLVMVPQAYAAPQTNKTAQSAPGPRRHITTIVFAGLAGAILGLSTLSFYGRPQDRLVNVPVGFAVGIITGTIYTTYKAATEPKDFYGQKDRAELWALDDTNKRDSFKQNPRATFSFEF